MNDKLICPFCQQELRQDQDGYYTCYTDNCGCLANGGNGASGSESLWLTLIDTKKKLDIALKELKASDKYYQDDECIKEAIKKIEQIKDKEE